MDFSPGDQTKTVTDNKSKIKTKSGGAIIGFDETDTEGNNFGDFIAKINEKNEKKRKEEMQIHAETKIHELEKTKLEAELKELLK